MDFSGWTDDELIEFIKEQMPKGDMPQMYDIPSPYGAGWNINRSGDEEWIMRLIVKGCPPAEIRVGYADGGDFNGDPLPAEAIEKVRQHLTKCAECAEDIAFLQSTPTLNDQD
jgi:hypothetical protein